MKYLFFSGSFHSKSRSLAILRCIEPYFSHCEIETPKLDRLPFYSEDLDNQKPQSVIQLLSSIEESSGILFCTPEYNHSIPAVLKNAIDWASRPAFHSVLRDKPVSIITQAQSRVGGARAQAHLKLILDSTLSKIHLCHEMMISQVKDVFDENMSMIDNQVIARLERHAKDFQDFVRTVRS